MDNEIKPNHLLPCPCCSASPVRRPYMTTIDDYGNKAESGVVFCTNCGLNVETGCGQEEAEKRWNRRNDGCSDEQMQLMHGISGKTRRQILDGYEEHERAVQSAIDWVNRQPD